MAISSPIELQHGDRGEWSLSDDRVTLFSIVKPYEGDREDGLAYDDEVVDITMPSTTNAGLALAFLGMARRSGVELAASWLLEKAIGVESYDLLVDELSTMEDPAEATKALAQIIERVQRIALGGLEAPKA